MSPTTPSPCAWCGEFFGFAAPERVQFFRYPDLDAKEELTGVRGNAHVAQGAIHSIWPTDRHEIVHLIAGGWGDPPALLGEGIAVYLSGGWQGESVKGYAANLAAEGTWVGLDRLMTTAQFRSVGDLVAYAEGGAFAQWVEEVKGHDVLRQLFGALSNRAAPAANVAAFERVLSASVADVDAALRAWVAK